MSLLLGGCEAPSYDKVLDIFKSDNQPAARRTGVVNDSAPSTVPAPQVAPEPDYNGATVPVAPTPAIQSSQAFDRSVAGPFNYECTDRHTVQVIHPDPEHAQVTVSGQRFDMYRVAAASGVKYATEKGLTGRGGLIWWAKGHDALLIEMILDDRVNPADYPLLATCRAKN